MRGVLAGASTCSSVTRPAYLPTPTPSAYKSHKRCASQLCRAILAQGEKGGDEPAAVLAQHGAAELSASGLSSKQNDCPATDTFKFTLRRNNEE
eukprot:22980-Pyramimonas_sp.AAC.1